MTGEGKFYHAVATSFLLLSLTPFLPLASAQHSHHETTHQVELTTEMLIAKVVFINDQLESIDPDQIRNSIESFSIKSDAIQTTKLLHTHLTQSENISPRLQSMTYEFLGKSLERNVYSPSSVVHAFNLLNRLPDSKQKSQLILQALEASKHNPSFVWGMDLHNCVDDSGFTLIHENAAAQTVSTMITRDHLALLALRGQQADLIALQRVLQLAINETRTSTKQLPSGYRPHDIESLIKLQLVRDNPSKLLDWAIDVNDANYSHASGWAMRQALQQSTDQSHVWNPFWTSLQARIEAKSNDYVQRATNLKMPSHDVKAIHTGACLASWCDAANTFGIHLPESVIQKASRAPDVSGMTSN